MAKTDTRDRTADEVEEGYAENGQEEQVAQPVVSDSRARRKRKRGQLVERVDDSEAVGKKDRPTPSRRGSKAPAKAAPRSVFQRIPVVRGIYNYFVAAAREMEKVTWPTREETTRLTRLVILVTIAFSIGLGVFDLFYGWWFRQALDHDTVFLGVGVIVLIIAGAITYFVFRQEEPSPF